MKPEPLFWWSDWIASRYTYFYKAKALRLLGRKPDVDGKYKNHSDFRQWKEFRTTAERDAQAGRQPNYAKARPGPRLAFRAGQAMARAGDVGNDGVAALHAAGYFKETLSVLIALARHGEAAEAVLRYATLPGLHRWLREPYQGPPGVDDPQIDDPDVLTEIYVREYDEEITREQGEGVDLDELYLRAAGRKRAELQGRLQMLDDVWDARAVLLRFNLAPLSADDLELEKAWGPGPDRGAAAAWGEIRRTADVALTDAAIVEAERAAWQTARPWAIAVAPREYPTVSAQLSWYWYSP